MEPTTILFLSAAGFAGGIVTAAVGGSSLITFPAMLAVGLPPLVAVGSNTVALTPSSFVAALSDYRRIPVWKPAFYRVIAVAMIGSGAGALLLIITPERAFMAIVPVLIGIATAMFAFSGHVRAWIFRHDDDPAMHSARADRIALVLLAPIAVYIGYFGAAASVMLLAILSLGQTGDLRTAIVLKNLLGGLTSAVAVVVFVVNGNVAWAPTLVMAAGGVFGGYVGGRLARGLPESIMRWLIIVVGCAFTVIYARRHW